MENFLNQIYFGNSIKSYAIAIITFDDKWLQEDALSEGSLSKKLGVIIEEKGAKGN